MNPTVQLIEPEVRELVADRKFGELREILHDLEAADVAEILEDLPVSDAAVVFRFLRRDDAAEAFAELGADLQEDLLEELGSRGASRVLEAMSPDDLAALIDELPTEVSTRLIADLKPETRRITQQILGYPEDSVGRLITPDYVKIRPEWTVARALEQIRHWGRDAETINWLYVVDDSRRLIDDLHVRLLLLADPEATVASLMDNRFESLNATDDREEAVLAMARYDRSAMPVLDSRGILVGIVTIDDITDVAEEEVTEDIQKFAGMEALDTAYTEAGYWEILRKRVSVLAILLVAQSLTIGVLGLFEERLAAASVLILFIPLIIASGGNTGTQTASLLIRAIAIGELVPADWWRVVRKELLTGLGLGALLGALATASVFVWSLTPLAHTTHPARVGLTVGVAVLGIVVWAVLLGSLFPLLLQRMGLDPATISSPLVATLMDVSGLVIYLAVALLILSGTLL